MEHRAGGTDSAILQFMGRNITLTCGHKLLLAAFGVRLLKLSYVSFPRKLHLLEMKFSGKEVWPSEGWRESKIKIFSSLKATR